MIKTFNYVDADLNVARSLQYPRIHNTGYKNSMSTNSGWKHCDKSQKEALEMIAHKIGRIVNGDPNHIDSWVDIAGYAQLIVNLLSTEKNGQQGDGEPFL